MEHEKRREGVVYLENFTSRKDRRPEPGSSEMPDSLSAWVGRYLELAVVGVRSRTVEWLTGTPPAKRRVSAFAQLAA